MDSSVFRDDSVKVSSIMNLLTQATDMLGDVRLHLSDYGERMQTQNAPAAESHQLEMERLKQSLYEKEDEIRSLRGDRLKLLDDVQAIQSQLTAAQTTAGELTTKRQETESALEARVRIAETEVRRLLSENATFARKLTRAHAQIETLLKTREELLDVVKLGEVQVKPSPLDKSNDHPPEEDLAAESPEDSTS